LDEDIKMKKKRSLRLSPWLLACLSWLPLASLSQAQAPPTAENLPGKVFTNKAHFRLPLKLADADRSDLQEVRPYAKSTTEGWSLKEAGAPGQPYFSFSAPRDDEYWFTVVIV